ncbi:hypothetical protein Zmor_015876 [Zophobas morio]|uniref:Uncharacterized protein n=1 Tax=Zophobas morio TaxID=2755281 RepID=A0AA38IMT7_9CUCU|nr:hypothetical protein Zmor_015876 [Zophobas morio]
MDSLLLINQLDHEESFIFLTRLLSCLLAPALLPAPRSPFRPSQRKIPRKSAHDLVMRFDSVDLKSLLRGWGRVIRRTLVVVRRDFGDGARRCLQSH